MIVEINNNKQELSEKQLFDRLNNDDYYYHTWRASSFIEYYINFLKALISNQEIVLLDEDFSNEELIKLGLSESCPLKRTYALTSRLEKKEDLLSRITSSKSTIILFTSGTTGLPKKVRHTVESLTRMTKVSSNHSKDVWGLMYNPTHMAGIQVLFQALLNWNKLIYLFKSEVSELSKKLDLYNVTHISATPTFYRMIITGDHVFNGIKRVTLGGEKSTPQLLEKLEKAFPMARINNIYASTEFGSLFVSKGEYFTISEDLQGKVKVENEELLIHNSLLPETEIEAWFKTGDLVEVVSNRPLLFKFLNRKSDVVNVGGYKVSLIEVEDEVRSMKEIKEARIYSKSNSVIGNMIYAEVVLHIGSDISKKDIVDFLKKNLQDHKLPRVIKFVNNIEKTRTGKLSRKL